MLILVLQARGKEAQRGVAYHQRLLPAHTQLKTRWAHYHYTDVC